MDPAIDRQAMIGATNLQLAPQVAQALKRTKNLVPSQAWLSSFLSTQRPGLPINALASTAGFRLLASDLKTSLDATKTLAFPSDLVNADVKETRVSGPVIVQVLDIEDMSRSRWGQIQDLEADERGERTKGREIVRIAAPDQGDGTGEGAAAVEVMTGSRTGSGSASSSSGPHKLLVEDVKGIKVYAMETRKLDGVNLIMGIGSKLSLRDVTVARGVLLLEPSNTTVLGGKVDFLQQHWKVNRKAHLNSRMQVSQADA